MPESRFFSFKTWCMAHQSSWKLIEPIFFYQIRDWNYYPVAKRQTHSRKEQKNRINCQWRRQGGIVKAWSHWINCCNKIIINLKMDPRQGKSRGSSGRVDGFFLPLHTSQSDPFYWNRIVFKLSNYRAHFLISFILLRTDRINQFGQLRPLLWTRKILAFFFSGSRIFLNFYVKNREPFITIGFTILTRAKTASLKDRLKYSRLALSH